MRSDVEQLEPTFDHVFFAAMMRKTPEERP